MAIIPQPEKPDFTRKTFFLVMTHDGSGLSGVPAALKDYCKGAIVGKYDQKNGGGVPRRKADTFRMIYGWYLLCCMKIVSTSCCFRSSDSDNMFPFRSTSVMGEK